MSHASIASTRWFSFLLGGVLFVPFWFMARRYIRRPIDYLATLEHEVTHILVGLVFFKRPLAIRITAKEGGHVLLTGSNMWISLAPYFLPTLTFLLMPLGLLLPAEHHPAWIGALGATVAYHLLSTWTEVGVMQSDFRKAGILQTLWVLPVANLVFYGSIFAYVIGGGNGFLKFWQAGAINMLELLLECSKYVTSKL